MNEFYMYFFLRQILQIIIFLSDMETLTKIFTIMLVDFTGQFKPFFNPSNIALPGKGDGFIPELNISDRVVLIDTIGSVSSYFQILILIIENKLFNKTQLTVLLGALLLHICSILNYLYDIPNGIPTEKNTLGGNRIFPDLFKPIMLAFLLYNNSKNKN